MEMSLPSFLFSRHTSGIVNGRKSDMAFTKSFRNRIFEVLKLGLAAVSPDQKRLPASRRFFAPDLDWQRLCLFILEAKKNCGCKTVFATSAKIPVAEADLPIKRREVK